MLHKFNTIKTRGFTLIELLVVIAIIGLLSTIIAAPIQNARKKARDSKKIAEIKALQLAIEQYAEANLNTYPIRLGAVAPTFMPILPAAAATTSQQVNNRDKYAFAPYFADGNEVQSGGAVYGYHIGAHLETYSQALDSDRDCVGASNDSDFIDAVAGGPFDGSTGTSTCTFFPGATYVSGLYASTTLTENYISGMVSEVTGTEAGAFMTFGNTGWPANASDFSGEDKATSTCNSITDCIFDLTGQI